MIESVWAFLYAMCGRNLTYFGREEYISGVAFLSNFIMGKAEAFLRQISVSPYHHLEDGSFLTSLLQKMFVLLAYFHESLSFRDSIEPLYRKFLGLLLQPGLSSNQPNVANIKVAVEVIESLQLAELDNFFQDACM